MITVEQLTKRYQGRVVVDDLTFAAPAGMVTGFLGPNGAGKSTTLRILLGLAHPDAGRATVTGRLYPDLPRPRRVVGAIIDSTGFHPGRSGRDHLRVVARGANIPQTRADEVLDLVGLRGAGSRHVGGYSLGMRQRLALAAALLGDPPVLVLDEPTNGLDPEGVAWLRGLLRTWAREGRCVLVSSHLLTEVEQVVDRVVIIKDGRLVLQGSVGELVADRGLLVRSNDPSRLRQVLIPLADRVGADGTNGLIVRGMTAEQVGSAAMHAGVALQELTSVTTNGALEELFLELTAESPASLETSV